MNFFRYPRDSSDSSVQACWFFLLSSSHSVQAIIIICGCYSFSIQSKHSRACMEYIWSIHWLVYDTTTTTTNAHTHILFHHSLWRYDGIEWCHFVERVCPLIVIHTHMSKHIIYLFYLCLFLFLPLYLSSSLILVVSFLSFTLLYFYLVSTYGFVFGFIAHSSLQPSLLLLLLFFIRASVISLKNAYSCFLFVCLLCLEPLLIYPMSTMNSERR